jgi:hypothetical protein
MATQAWLQTKAVIEARLPNIMRGSRTITNYTLRYTDAGFRLSKPSLSYDLVNCYLPNGRFRWLTINRSKNEQWNLYEDKIEKAVFGIGDELYPRFDWVWLLDGVLDFMRIDLSGTTFVNYHRNKQMYRDGDPYLLRQIPEKVRGVRAILNQSISWEIDVETCAMELLIFSELEEFLHQLR